MTVLNKIPQILTKTQKEFLVGNLLGDGGICFGGIRSLYPRLTCQRQAIDKDYVYYQYSLFKDFYGTGPKFREVFDKRNNKIYTNYSILSRSGLIFKELYNKWYPDGKKIVPKDIELTSLTLLIWFLDDGCVITSGNSLKIKFSTDAFIKDDVIFLCNLLENFIQEKLKIYKNGSGYIIRGETLATVKIINIIDPIFLECMERKRKWKNYDWVYFNENKSCFGPYRRSNNT